MKSKKSIVYHIQTTLEGEYDIVANTTQSKIVCHTDNKQAAIDIINFLIKYNQ